MLSGVLCCTADDSFLVPTTVTYQALQREGVAGGMAAELVAKVGEAVSKVCFALLLPYNVRSTSAEHLLTTVLKYPGTNESN
jgi:hypothetical protein